MFHGTVWDGMGNVRKRKYPLKGVLFFYIGFAAFFMGGSLLSLFLGNELGVSKAGFICFSARSQSETVEIRFIFGVKVVMVLRLVGMCHEKRVGYW